MLGDGHDGVVSLIGTVIRTGTWMASRSQASAHRAPGRIWSVNAKLTVDGACLPPARAATCPALHGDGDLDCPSTRRGLAEQHVDPLLAFGWWLPDRAVERVTEPAAIEEHEGRRVGHVGRHAFVARTQIGTDGRGRIRRQLDDRRAVLMADARLDLGDDRDLDLADRRRPLVATGRRERVEPELDLRPVVEAVATRFGDRDPFDVGAFERRLDVAVEIERFGGGDGDRHP